jgi:hypothetical protein
MTSDPYRSTRRTTVPTTEQLTFLDAMEVLARAGAIDNLGLVEDKLAGITYDEWESMGYAFGAANKGQRFAMGDWLIFGEREWSGDRWAQASDATGLREATLRNYAWVSGAVKRSRRREDLTWTHHEVVASLPPRDQRRWLTRAASVPLSTDALREEIKDGGQEPGDSAVEPIRGKVTLKEAARQVWISSSKHGETYHVPVETMLALGRSLGEPV